MRFLLFLIILSAFLPLKAQIFISEAERDIIPIQTDSFAPTHIPGIYPCINNKHLPQKSSRSWLYRKTFEENLFVWKKNDFDIRINPVIDFQVGYERNRVLGQNTRGIILNGQIENKFIFRTEFYENQTVFPKYISNRIDSLGMVPGLVRAKPFKNNGFDYGMVFSQLLWQPAKHYAMCLGYDRLHFGEGYRSFVLSESSHAYTFTSHHYVKKNWAISLFLASMRNSDLQNLNIIPHSESGAYQAKWFSLTHISWSPVKKMNISLTENTVFMPWDSTHIQFYPVSVLPVPFLKTLLYEKNGPHHVMNTVLLDYNIKNGIHVYGQFACDEIKLKQLKKYNGLQAAAQVGVKIESTETQKKNFIQAELNIASDNVYTSNSYWTSMTHMNQPLGHPYGQKFIEWILRGQFHYKRFRGLCHISQIFGNNIPSVDSYTGIDTNIVNANPFLWLQPPENVIHIRLELAYTINPQTHLQVFAGFAGRAYNSNNWNYIYHFGIRHKIRNQNYDYF